jgi:hypothetical protein
LADTSAWITLAAALGGVALTGALSLATAALTHKWNEQARLQADREQEVRTIREQRREAYIITSSLRIHSIKHLIRYI